MSDLTQNDKDLIWASGHYLTEHFPEEFVKWEEEEIHGFIEDHIWEGVEGYPPSYIWEQIDNLASSVRNYTNNQEQEKLNEKFN